MVLKIRKFLIFNCEKKKSLNIAQLIAGFGDLSCLIFLVVLLCIVYLLVYNIQKNTQILRTQLDKLSLSEDSHMPSSQTKKENFTTRQKSPHVPSLSLSPEKGHLHPDLTVISQLVPDASINGLIALCGNFCGWLLFLNIVFVTVLHVVG